MKTDQHTSIPLSKLIHDRVPELRGIEMFWVYYEEWGNKKGRMCRVKKGYRLERFGEVTDSGNFPAYSFIDCLRAIQIHAGYGHIDIGYGSYSTEHWQHRILDAYLLDNLTIGENTERYLTSLFTK